MKRRVDVIRVVATAAVVALLATTASAQYVTTGELFGRVTDDQGAPLAGVNLTLKAEDVLQPYVATTDAEGKYRIVNITPRKYTVTAELTSFVANPVDVNIRVGSLTRVDVQMSSGQFKKEIRVTAAAPQIEAVESQVNKYISFEEIQNLPLQNRQFLDVLNIVPGVTRGVPTGALADRGPRNSFSIHGARSNQNDFLLDGASNNDKSDLNYEDIASTQVLGGPRTGNAGAAGATFQVGTALQTYNLDAVQEVQVATSMFSAEFGSGGSGGVINVITRSGTDVLSGSATLQQQRDAWVAGNDTQDIERTIGAVSLGGPFIKGKTHYFGSYERDDQKLGFDYSRPSYYVPEWTRGLDLTANHTKRDRFTFKISNRFTDDHNLTGTANYINERANVLQTIFRERQRDDAVPEYYLNRSIGLVIRDLKVFGAEGNRTLESVANTTHADRTFDSSNDNPREIFNFYIPSYHSYTIGENSPDNDNNIDTFGLSEKLSLSTDTMFNKFGVGVDYFRQQSFQTEYLSLYHYPEEGTTSYLRYPETDLSASVTDLWGFGQTDWFLNPKTTLNAGVRLQRDNLVRDFTVEPRVGVAYDPGGNGRQVIRVGGGIYHDRTNLIGVTGALRPPTEIGDIIDGVQVPDSLPSVTEVDPNLVLPTIYKFVAGYQRQVGPRTTAGVTLFANLSRDLFYTNNQNRPDRDGNRPDPTRGTVYFYSNYGYSDVYDAELEIRHQFANGSMVQASYTYEHSEGNSVFDYVAGNDPINRGTQYDEQMATYDVNGPLSSQLEHQVKLSGVFMLPFGFQFSTFVDWNSGRPYYFYEIWYELPSYYPHYQIIDGYNSQNIGDFFNADVRIAKSFKIGGSHDLLIYIDGFNVTDRQNVLERNPLYAYNYGSPIGDPGTTYYANWTKPTLYGPRRSVQVGAKFSF